MMNVNTMQMDTPMEQNLALDQDQRNSNGRERRRPSLAKRLKKIASISQIIRILGGCAILVSMSLFMFKGWADGNDISRYLRLLMQTCLLTGAGLVLTFLVKEFKGARAFLGLALASVVANFTILGSLTYSLFPLDKFIVEYPAMMKWVVVDGSQFSLVFIGAVSLLSLVTFFGFSIFARPISKPLTAGFLFLCALLLVPIRSSLIVTGLAAFALWGACFLISYFSKNENLVFTKETKSALAILLLPGIIIITRALSFYHIDEVSLLVVSGLVFAGLRSIPFDLPLFVSRLIDIVQYGLGIIVAFLVVQILPASFDSFGFFITSTIIIGFVLDQLLHGRSQDWKASATTLTTVSIVPLSLISALNQTGLIFSLQCVAICGFLLALNLFASRKLDKNLVGIKIAMVGLLGAIIVTFIDLVNLVQLGNWVIVGLAGGGLILGASLYERYGLSLSKD